MASTGLGSCSRPSGILRSPPAQSDPRGHQGWERQATLCSGLGGEKGEFRGLPCPEHSPPHSRLGPTTVGMHSLCTLTLQMWTKAQGMRPAPASRCPVRCRRGSGQEDMPTSPPWVSPAGFGAQNMGWWLWPRGLDAAGALRLVSCGWGAGVGRSWDSWGSPMALQWP